MRVRGLSGGFLRVAAGVVVLGATASGAVTAGGLSSEDNGITSPTAAAVGSWTVLQYSMSDTDLEPYMMADVNEMGEVGSNENLNIVALVGRSPEYGEEPVLDIGDWVGAKLLHIQQAMPRSLPISAQPTWATPRRSPRSSPKGSRLSRLSTTR